MNVPHLIPGAFARPPRELPPEIVLRDEDYEVLTDENDEPLTE